MIIRDEYHCIEKFFADIRPIKKKRQLVGIFYVALLSMNT